MTKIIYTSVHPHTTWRLKMTYPVKKPPKKLMSDLLASGWVSWASTAPGEVDVVFTGTASSDGDWTSKEREEAMYQARKVLAKHGFEVVPYHKLEMADCL